MAVYELKVDGQKIKSPTSFVVERFNITKSGRVTSGAMVMDLIAKKRKFLLRYTVMSGKELNTILSLIDGNNMFFTLSYVENGTAKSAICYAGHVPTELFRTDGVWYWKNVNFDLIER